jgi:ornithine cyclodeaminase/alanine dehydrogenase-like protein (mu-crystallin family)
VGIVACGVQGRSNLEALALEFEIERVHAFDVRRDVAERYAAQMAQRLGLDVRVVETAEDAVREMDIVVTSGPIRKRPAPVIGDDWLARGAFAAPVDFDSYWKGEVLTSVDRFVTDDVEQLFYYQETGYFQILPPRDLTLDLGDVVSGETAGRQRRDQRTLVMNLGLALDDVAVAPLVYRAAIEKDLGVRLER